MGGPGRSGLVRHGVGLDRNGAFPVDQRLASREGVDLLLEALVAEAGRGSRGGVNPDGVLGEPAAVAVHETCGARLLAKDLRHARDRVEAVAVEWPAPESEPSADSERTVLTNSELCRRDLHRRGKAAVEVEVADLFQALPGQLDGPGSRNSDRGRAVELGARGQKVAVVGLRR